MKYRGSLNEIMKSMKKIQVVGLLLLSLLTGVMTGCGLSQQAGTGEKTDANVKTYYVGTRGTFKPFTYMDDKDQLTGYDLEILKEVEKRNKDIKFEFKTMSVESAFVALEAKQIDIIANQMTHNSDRDTKYIFTKESNNYTISKLAVRGDRNDIQSFDDLKGKTLSITPTGETTRLVKEFNETANPKIEVSYSDKGSADSLNLVATGRADAGISYEVAIREAKETLGLNVKAAGPVISSVPTYYILRKDEDEQQLADKIDATLKEMRADGTLQKLSEKYLGADYTGQPK